MPIISGGGGGGAPTGAAGGDLGGTYPDPTVDLASGGTIAGALVVRNDTGLTVKNSAGTVTHLAAGNGAVQLIAGATGTTSVLTVDTGKITLKDENGDVMLDIEGSYISLGHVGEVIITPSNYLAISSHSAIADAELDPGLCAFWFDQTNGAGNTKLMVKGKSADGTVKTATILLA